MQKKSRRQDRLSLQVANKRPPNRAGFLQTRFNWLCVSKESVTTIGRKMDAAFFAIHRNVDNDDAKEPQENSNVSSTVHCIITDFCM